MHMWMQWSLRVWIGVIRVQSHDVLMVLKLAGSKITGSTFKRQRICAGRHRQDDIERLPLLTFIWQRDYPAALQFVMQLAQPVSTDNRFAVLVFEFKLAIPGNVVEVILDVLHPFATARYLHHDFGRAFCNRAEF